MPVEIEAIYEHMHLIGKTCKIWAELPDHTIRHIIKINDWDFNWQSTYHVKASVTPAAHPAKEKKHPSVGQFLLKSGAG